MEMKCPECRGELTKDDFYVGYCLNCKSLFAQDFIQEYREKMKREKQEELLKAENIRDKEEMEWEERERRKIGSGKIIAEEKEKPLKVPKQFVVRTVLMIWVVILMTIVSSLYIYSYFHSTERRIIVLEKEIDEYYSLLVSMGAEDPRSYVILTALQGKEAKLAELKGRR